MLFIWSSRFPYRGFTLFATMLWRRTWWDMLDTACVNMRRLVITELVLRDVSRVYFVNICWSTIRVQSFILVCYQMFVYVLLLLGKYQRGSCLADLQAFFGANHPLPTYRRSHLTPWPLERALVTSLPTRWRCQVQAQRILVGLIVKMITN